MAEIERAWTETKEALEIKEGCEQCEFEILRGFFRKIDRILSDENPEETIIIK